MKKLGYIVLLLIAAMCGMLPLAVIVLILLAIYDKLDK